MEKIRWGVLGTADIARGQTIPGMKLADNCELWAIAGRSLEKAQRFQKEFGFRKAYEGYEALLADPELEAVYIPLPNDLHCEWTVKALQAGKHVLCEKPLAVSEQQAESMFRAAEDNGVCLMEAFAYLHSPFVSAVKAELDSGAVGDVRYIASAFITGRRPDTDIRLRRETFGGALFDLGCYDVSLALWLMGREPEAVSAAATFSERHIDLFTSAILGFSGGAVADLACGMVLPGGRLDRFQIRGTKGIIESSWGFNQPGPLTYTVSGEEKTLVSPNNYQLEVEQLGCCIRNSEKPHVSKEFSLLNARVMDRILREIGY